VCCKPYLQLAVKSVCNGILIMYGHKFQSATESLCVPRSTWIQIKCLFLFDVFQKITVAECIETQSKAMMMLTIDQLSYLLKFALQKMKQPGVSIL